MEPEKTPLVEYEQHGSITVGTVRAARVLDAVNVTEFGNRLLEYVDEHPGVHLLLNFAQVNYLSSAALTELLKVNEATQRTGGGVRLCALSPEIASVFQITNLDKLFLVEPGETVDHALHRYERSLQIAAEEDEWTKRGL
jgi:anti-sigma B factor antagonist